MKQKKVLVMTDSPKLHTGFGKVGREVWTRLNRTGKYDITAIGWFHQDTHENSTYPIVTTKKDAKGRLTQRDKYAHESFPAFVDKYKPDMVWTLGDHWMTDHVAKAPNRKEFTWVAYFPIDGMPSPSKWGKVVENMDIPVAYGAWGMKVIKQRAPKANIKYIYHGVDTDIFKPKGNFDKTSDKQRLLGLKEDKKIIGIVSRNQPRKAFDKLFEAYFYILNGEYYRCEDCHNLTRKPFHLLDKTFSNIEECKHCKSKNIKKGSPRDDVRLYVHAAPVDCGWDLLDLQKDFNLNGKILINPQLKIGVGVSEMTLDAIYNCMDIFTLPTRGEGFGLPVLEAMSCGVPIVATDYSAHTEWSGVGGILVPPSDSEAEPLTNIRRALIDMDLYTTALLKILDNPELAKKYGEAGRERALEMDWKNVVTQWEELVDSVLYPDGAPEKIEVSDLEYNLEEM